MTDAGTTAAQPKWMTVTGWVLGVLPSGLLLFSATGKLTKMPGLEEGMTHLGWPMSTALPLGVVEALCTVLYLVPRTAVLGAVLLTGYAGGAMATHARIGELFVMQALLGVALWLGLFLRDTRVRAVLPIMK